MSQNVNAPPVEGSTRDRILLAAMRRFSTHSYETTGLRDIATDAGFDVAWVHRSFGSKERLFAECLQVATARQRPASADATAFIDSLVETIVRPRGVDDVRPLDIMVRSFSSPEASRVLKELGEKEFLMPLAATAGEPSQMRAGLALAFVAGVGILRNVIGASALTTADEEAFTNAVKEIFAHILQPSE